MTRDGIIEVYNSIKKQSYDTIRTEFIENYGPNVLHDLNGVALVEKLFTSAKSENDIRKRGLFAWLEHGAKKDSVHKGLFGSGRDGSFQNGILLCFEEETSQRRYVLYDYGKPKTDIDEQTAINYANDIKDVIWAIYSLINESELNTVDDYGTLENQIKALSSVKKNSYWTTDGKLRTTLLKYFHILFPNKISGFYKRKYINKVANLLEIQADAYISDFCLNGSITLYMKSLGPNLDGIYFAGAIYSVIGQNDKKEDLEFSNDKKGGRYNMKKQTELNLILYGPPGTGKTYKTVIEAVAIIDREDAVENKNYGDILKRYNKLKEQGQIAFTTFHQSYGYEEFIEGIKPDLNAGEVKYKLEDGVFKEFCERAKYDNDNNYVFIIDEINRGNVSKIFGELITLIEPTKRLDAEEEMKCTLPYSKKTFGVPKNVYILGTMNTADRSLVQLDSALRRRFAFEEMMPDYDVISKNIGEVDGIDVAKLLETINKHITVLLDREHQIGHSYFLKLKENKSVIKLAEIFKKNIIPLLQEYFFDDYELIKKVLGDENEKGNFISSEQSLFDGRNIYEIAKEMPKDAQPYIAIYDSKNATGNTDNT